MYFPYSKKKSLELGGPRLTVPGVDDVVVFSCSLVAVMVLVSLVVFDVFLSSLASKSGKYFLRILSVIDGANVLDRSQRSTTRFTFS